MKTEHFKLSPSDVEPFKLACKEFNGSIELVSINSENDATIRYTHPHNLFYLGQMLQLKERSLSLNTK